jgi:hypothetical protein
MSASHPLRTFCSASAFHPLRTEAAEVRSLFVEPILSVEPIYGWGWVGTAPDQTRDTPAPFNLLLSLTGEGEWEGVVQTPGHEFEGQTVTLLQRHRDWDGCVNVTVGADRPPVAEGWAMVIDHRRLEGNRQGY